jgi:hypothetical protein
MPEWVANSFSERLAKKAAIVANTQNATKIRSSIVIIGITTDMSRLVKVWCYVLNC